MLYINSILKKIILIILLSLGLAIGIFALLFFNSIKIKSRDISKDLPIASIINTELMLLNDVFIFEESEPFDKKATYVLLDENHEDYNEFINRNKKNKYDLRFVARVDKGNKLIFQKAKIFTNGVSGVSKIVLFGNLKTKNANYKIAYYWGEKNNYKVLEGKYDYYTFKIAPWQTEPLNKNYKIEPAKW